MRKHIRTYVPFAANELKRQMAYKGAFYLFIFISLFGSFVNYFLWMAVYGSSGKNMIGGFTEGEMVIYIFMAYVTGSMVSIGIAGNVADDVVQGTIAMNLIKPIDYRMSLIWSAGGVMLYRFLIPGIFVWIGTEIYRVSTMGFSSSHIVAALFYLISSFMSFLLYVLFDFCFGMIAFATTYVFGMLMARAAILSFLMGQLIPLSFFPEWAQRAFDFLPFSSMMYTPVMIYMGKYSGGEVALSMARQLVWVIILYVLGSVIWKKATKRLVVLGG